MDQRAEACLACHENKESLEASPMIGKPRFFTDSQGRRMLGSTAVIRNEPTCSRGGCHANAADQSVLGVLDIITPLGKIDQALRANTYTIIGLSLGFIILAGLLVSYLVQRMIYQPLHDLEAGSSRLASGNLEQMIPVRSDDEFGQLAESFNSMTLALRKSHLDLKNWGRTLEQKVEEARIKLQLAHAETARSEKLASVGLLAAGIAHELNNPLTGILTFSCLVRKNVPDGSSDADDLDLVIKETKRCAVIIRRLLDFTREKKAEKSFSNLNTLIEDTIHLIEQPAHANSIDIRLDLAEHLPEVWLDEDLIKQVIMNMMVNAQHAIEGAGSITIKTRFLDEYPGPDPGFKAGSVAEITISDTGCGIPDEYLQRIFDPFFTTKGVGRGTGLGLSVSHGTIEAHGGVIEVHSVEGAGTEFRIYLPMGESLATKQEIEA